MQEKILIIKLGALGDMVQAATAFAALRDYHRDAHVTLLTTSPYQEMTERMGYFDEVWIDEKIKLHQITKLLKFRGRLRQANFQCIYDLQNVDRTKLYSLLLGKKGKWVAPRKKDRFIHPEERFTKLFQAISIPFSYNLDLRHIAEPYTGSIIPQPYALLIPGASMAHGGRKKWSEEFYEAIASYLLKKGIQPVLIGGPSENWQYIKKQTPKVIDLCGATNFYQVIGLAQKALFTLGNDTGPTLLAASSGCKTLTLYASCNPPSLGGARGENHFSLYEPDLRNLTAEQVIHKLQTSGFVDKSKNYQTR